MLIIGSGSFLADLLCSLSLEFKDEELAVYNDLNISYPDYIQNDFRILKDEAEVKNYFKHTDNRFVIAVGNNLAREQISKK